MNMLKQLLDFIKRFFVNKEVNQLEDKEYKEIVMEQEIAAEKLAVKAAPKLLPIKIIDISDDLPWHPDRTWEQRPRSAVTEFIVHQALAAKATTRGVNRYHITPSPHNHLSIRGAPHIAYHFTIDRDGTIYKCNALTDITWQCKGHNYNAIGLCLMGDFTGPSHPTNQEPTKKQLKSLGRIMEYAHTELGIAKAYFYGHIDVGKKICPGNTVYEAVKKFRTK